MSFSKQNYESFWVYGDFTNVMDENDLMVLVDCQVKAFDADDVEVTNEVIIPNSLFLTQRTMLACKVFNGNEDEGPYKITFYDVMDNGNRFELDGFMDVSEI